MPVKLNETCPHPALRATFPRNAGEGMDLLAQSLKPCGVTTKSLPPERGEMSSQGDRGGNQTLWGCDKKEEQCPVLFKEAL